MHFQHVRSNCFFCFLLSQAVGKESKIRGRERERKASVGRASCLTLLTPARRQAQKCSRIIFLFSERLISLISLFPVWLLVMCTEQLRVRPRTQTHKCTRMRLESPPAQQLTVSLVLPRSSLTLYLWAPLSETHSVTAGGLTRHRLPRPYDAGVCQRAPASVRPSALNP